MFRTLLSALHYVKPKTDIEHYMSRTGRSSLVRGFTIGDDYITVHLTDNTISTYTYASAGKDAVERMKQYARNQSGLNSYILLYKPTAA